MITWLFDEPRTVRGYATLLLNTFVFVAAWSLVWVTIFEAWGLLEDRLAFEQRLDEAFARYPRRMFLLMQEQVLWEEIRARIIPLTLALMVARRTKWWWLVALAFALFSVIWFGWMHGGWAGLWLDGVGTGIPLGLIFLKCGGLRGGLGGYLKASGTVVGVHMGWNVIVTGLRIL
ncbi:MAG: hypothetical protein U1D26_02335 [Patescibacteria group bacterium]|nr:hypothetical protein [bacterium]MDZ4227295.1 hypothetical protein [Patescibacteria group bacterium]